MKILFVGDSLTYGYFASVQNKRFSSLICAAQGATEINQGDPGATVASYLAAYPTLPSADVTIIELGTNDVGSTSLASFQTDYTTLLSRVNSPVTICLGVWNSAGASYDAVIESLAPNGNFVALGVYQAQVQNKNLAGTSTYLGTSDNFHPNDLGHAVIATLTELLLPTTATLISVGSYDQLNDRFNLACDLNDHTTLWLQQNALKLDQPKKIFGRSSNIRTPGERITAWQYQNRHIQASLRARGSSATDLLQALQRLEQAIENPPFTLRLALPGGTTWNYADVVACTHNIPSDPLLIRNLAIKDIQIDFECKPTFRWSRQTLQNLATNPGFEQSSAPGVTVFTDNFANVNAYSAVAGTAPLAMNQSYADAVLADAPLRWYRLGEPNGTTAFDYGSTQQAATVNGGVTLFQGGAIKNDPNASMLFNGSSGYISAGDTGLPSGSLSGGATLEAWVYLPATPGGYVQVMVLGSGGSGGSFGLGVTTAGLPYVSIGGGGTATAGSALSLNTWHHLVGTYAGGNVYLYVDGTLVATQTSSTPAIATTGMAIGASVGGGSYFAGYIDEAAIYNTALGGARVSAHYNAGTANSYSGMDVIGGSTVVFGSSVWGSLHTWQVRFRANALGTTDFYLHRMDANNAIYAKLTQSAFSLYQETSGTSAQIASQAVTLTAGHMYWFVATQFPTPYGLMPALQVGIYADNNGAIGSQVVNIGPTGAYDQYYGDSGMCAIQAEAYDVIIGNSYGAGNTVQLFGPAGWTFNPNPFSRTGQATAAWEQSTTNTYPGPVTSFAAARIDFPPAGTVDCYWSKYAGSAYDGAPGSSNAVPVRTGGDVIAISAWTKSSGLGASGVIQLLVNEYDSTGALLYGAQLVQGVTGNQASWTQISGTYTTHSNGAYLDIELRAADTTGGSPGASVWFDNVQVWNQSQCGSDMPYCELRFPHSPAQLLVTGIEGDTMAPAFVVLGTYQSSFGQGYQVQFGLGRRAQSSAGARLVQVGHDTLAAPVLDPGSYGGYFMSRSGDTGGPANLRLLIGDMLGYYYVIARMQTNQSSGNLANLQVRVIGSEFSGDYDAGSAGVPLWTFYGPYNDAPFGHSAAWQAISAGQAGIPPAPLPALTDPEQVYVNVYPQWIDNTAGGSTMLTNWLLLLPLDGNLLSGVINNPNNAGAAVTNSWLWAIFDGISDLPAWAWALGSNQIPNPQQAAGGPGTAYTGYVNINPNGDPFLTLDPTLSVNGYDGVNQLAGYLTTAAPAPVGSPDYNAYVLPLYAEITYAPRWLFPR